VYKEIYTKTKILASNIKVKYLFCDKVCQWLATGRWFSPRTPVSSTK